MSDYFTCEDCGRTMSTTPRGDTQGVACPDCGGQRMFRTQPSPTQSDGAIRNMVNMDTGKDEGGNPDGTGILAPAGGQPILSAFMDSEHPGHDIHPGTSQCPLCSTLTDENSCPNCGTWIDRNGISIEHGLPAELRDQIAGAPLTEGTIVGADDTPPFDTGNRGRDEYTHGHVMASFYPDEDMTDIVSDTPANCPQCHGLQTVHPEDGQCINCGYIIPYDGGEWYDMPGSDRLLDKAYREQGDGYSWKNPESFRGQLGPAHQGNIVAALMPEWGGHDPMNDLRCPNCKGEVMTDPGMGEIFCTKCDQGWPIGREENTLHLPVQQRIRTDYEHPEDLRNQILERAPGTVGPLGLNYGPAHHGKISELVVPMGQKPMTPNIPYRELGPQEHMRWQPGQYGRGLVINGQPHTWSSGDGTLGSKSIFHGEYVKQNEIDPNTVDWRSGIEIGPRGEVENIYGGKDVTPFITADPRLKQVEGQPTFSFGHTMDFISHTNNMNPYEALWGKVADVQFDQGPLQNTAGPSPEYSVVTQPSEVGLHGAHTGRKGLLSFLDAHVNGIPVRGHGGEIITKYGIKSSPDFGKQVVVAVHHPTHLPAAVEAIQHPLGRSTLMSELVPKIQNGEVPPPPGINPQTLQPEPGAFPERHQAGLMEDLGEVGGGIAGEMIDPFGGGVAGAALGAGLGAEAGKGIGGQVGGLMSKAMGGGSGQQEPAYQSPLNPLTGSVLAAVVESDYETPSSVPDIGVKHDDPEDVDQKEFNDQDKSPENPMNPNLQDSGASGEDEVRKNMDKPSQGQFAPDSPGIQRMEMLMPLIEKYYHSDESGAHDPMLKGLHEMLEAENPGYLNNADPEAAEAYMRSKRQPDHVHANIHEALVPPMQQGGLTIDQQMLDPTGQNPSLQPQPQVIPSSQAPPGGTEVGETGHCAQCGSATAPDGSCPTCGARYDNGAQGQNSMQQQHNPMTFAHTDLIAAIVDSANHQGPVTPEQIASVQQWLIQQGRVDEVPNVPLDPGNPEYAKILAEIQNDPMHVPTVTPEEQTQPPAPQPSAPGGMPVPGMGGEPGGQPMQPMSSFLPDFTAADNVAPRCPVCNSGTTGLVGDADGHARCHSCSNVWKLKDMLDDSPAAGSSSIARVAIHEEHQHGGEQANPIGVPAAEQEGRTNQGGDEDSSLTWKDSMGAPLRTGEQYQMINPSYSLPDLVRVERVKPDGIDVTLLGTYANDPTGHDPNTLTSSAPISREDMESQNLSFEPINQTADDQNNEPPPGSAAPGLPQVPPSGQTTDEHASREPQMSMSSVHDNDCPRCGHREFTSSMISAEATEHNCFRCGHDWVTEEKAMEYQAGIDLSWINEDDNAEDFLSPREGMMRAAMKSRSLGDIAEKDGRLRAIRERLDQEGQERQQRVAGKNFTRKEQRELIDEDGVARNSSLLDLSNTHYEARYDESGKANAMNVPNEHLFLGL